MLKKIHIAKLIIGLVVIFFSGAANSQVWNPGHKVGVVTGKYHFSYSQTPDQLVEIFPAAVPNTGLTYQWEQSTQPTTGFSNISGATSSGYTFSSALTQTTYYRRKTTSGGNSIYSNVIKITVVSVNWEDINYVRVHDVLTTGVTTWTAVDQLAIGPKLQTTSYMDGLGRSTQQISRETATPASGSLWGDMVQFSEYDSYGRQSKNYLPYTTTSQSGKYKTAPSTDQAQYYTTNYNESPAYNSVTFENNPLNRILTVKKPGTSWAASAGVWGNYGVNLNADNVQKFSVDYVQGNAPVNNGAYPEKVLYKISSTDENGKTLVEYLDKAGRLILKKVQIADAPSSSYGGWICTYYVYDDFGLLRYEIQPEGVDYLANNSWSFTGTNGQQVLAEQVFQYNYDDKGRVIWKKNPGAAALNMIYDVRDRLVFAQDGNQAGLSTPQWTASIYDELDRPIVSTLYNTTKTITQLKSDISGASASSTITINNSGTVSVTTTTHLNPISSSDLNNSSVTTILSYNFYDNYSFNAVKTFNTNYTNTSAYSTSDPDVMLIAKTQRTTSMPTGSMTRVLGTTTFLSSTAYYDERGSLIQTLSDNIKTGTDITTLQHHFDGRVLSTCSDHTTNVSGYTNYKILTKNLFDKLGRVTSIQKQFGSNAFKTIASYDYDDAGRLKTKHLDPGYTAGGNSELESLNYSYNIHGQLTGINKDYALKTSGSYNKWSHFFGQYIGFDNRDNVFTNPNLLGQATGVVWNTQGDDAQRRYNYTYDNAGRLTKAAFTEKQHTGDSWSSSQMDFSISGTSGKITYDLNGNLLNMLHKGVLPGTATPITVDELSYSYNSLGNKLQSVTDNMTNTSVNGKFGDFKDGTNSGTPDYVYDNNGNLVIDLNKNVKDIGGVTGNGVKYNFLDKPEQIRIVGKGTITIVYSASGEKLQRTFTPEPSGAAITTTYINQYVYQETGGTTTLQYINFEEGRIRVVTPTSQGNGLDALIVDGNMDLPNSKRGAYDYYIMDYQQNVRMILTEEVHTASNTATMETDRATLEESIFGQTGGSNEVATTRYNTPSAWTGNTTAKVSRLGTNAGKNVGPNTLQKVMAGDKITATVQYYYSQNAGGNSNMVNMVLNSIIPALSGGGVSSIVAENGSNISTQLGGTTGFINAVQPNGSNPSGNTPQAFLTVLFFDERFKFVEAADGGLAQQQVASSVTGSGASLTISNVKAPKNGYAFVYVSNQSYNDVYFDNLQVQVAIGNIIEENHYYSYGLKITTLSSKKFGDSYEGNLKNNYLYQGAFAEMDDDIGWNDFALRNYDPQIGRWVQQDPYQEFASPYVGMGGDPINLTDPSGGSVIPGGGGGVSTLSTTADKAITLGAVVIFSSKASTTIKTVTTATTSINLFSKVSIGINTAFKVANLINNVFNTVKVGDPTADYLNSIMTKTVDTDIEQLWTNSKHGTEQNHEWGATLVNMNGEYKVTLQHPGAGSGSVQATFPTAQRSNKKGKPIGNYYGAFVAIIHTHPYPKEITKGYGFHAGDISGMREFFEKKNIIQGPITKPFYLIESGSIRYALVVEDMALAEKFFADTPDEKILKLFNTGYSQSTKHTGQERMVDGVLNVIGDQNVSGLSLYQTNGADKTKFFKAVKN
jgi:RHS repeat-associated protein